MSNFNINIINSKFKFVVICEIGEIYIYKTNNDFKCILDNYLNDFGLKMTDIKIFDKFGKNLNFENDNLNQIFIFSKKEINKNQIDKKFSDKIKNIIKNYKLDLNFNKEILPDVYSNFELFKENEKILVKETFEKILEFFEHFKSIYNTLKLNFQISYEIINNFLLQKFSIDVFINNNNNNEKNENIKEINKISNIISELEKNFKEDVIIFDNLFMKYFEKIQRDFLNFKEYLNIILNKNENYENDKNYNNIINNIINLKIYYSNFEILEKLKKQIEDVNNYPIKFRKYLENFAYIVNETFLKLNNNNNNNNINNNITNNVIINNNNININNLKILYKRTENNNFNNNYIKNNNNNNNNLNDDNKYKIENIENFYIKNSYNKINNKNILNEYDNKIENLISNLINELNKNSENFDKLTFEFKNILNNSSKKNIHINNNNNNKNKTSLQINKIIYQFNEIKKTFFNQINYILSIKNNQILKLKNELNSNNFSDLIHINNLNINNECIFIPYKNGIYVCINFNEKNYPIYKFNYILDINSFNDEIKNLINNKLLIIIGTISNINKINNNDNNNDNNIFNLLNNEENFYYLVTLNKINYIIDYPNQDLNLKNYLFNFNLN